MRRMDLLLTFGNNQEARGTYTESISRREKLSKADLCELNYVDAKIDRKMKKIDAARKKFSDLVMTCESPTKKKALFMDLMLASMKRDELSLPKFENFLVDYPNDSLSDDVMIFKTNLFLDLGRTKEAQEVLANLIERYPNGDMIHRALFLQGFNFAQLGKADLAIQSFKKLLQINAKDSLEFASAQYWIARLSIFSDLNSLKNPHKRIISRKSKHSMSSR